ncbi:hypothetical protein AXF42_Ash003194 [Apostasia shenzhenica]|uniref:Uncharacterized protein n=1 Tax=Apostasia shenzhenica TaxID=1088818 RepID=A0A2I0BFG1_9ASPA|nr:hypothetical protein AXF42_Ash003194 [Apostasia shenzhenica]
MEIQIKSIIECSVDEFMKPKLHFFQDLVSAAFNHAFDHPILKSEKRILMASL